MKEFQVSVIQANAMDNAETEFYEEQKHVTMEALLMDKDAHKIVKEFKQASNARKQHHLNALRFAEMD